MSMSYIYNCKLYKAHRNKDSINAAIVSPINTELIKQIDDLQIITEESNNIEDNIDDSLSFDSFQSDDALDDSDNQSLDLDNDTDEELDSFDDFNQSDSDLDSEDDLENGDIQEVDPKVIQERLDDSSDTSGVSRVVLKDNELWIHYNDKINLNNIMESVIYSIIDMYPDAEFNRLARTENAIVFVVNDESEKGDDEPSGVVDVIDEEE